MKQFYFQIQFFLFQFFLYSVLIVKYNFMNQKAWLNNWVLQFYSRRFWLEPRILGKWEEERETQRYPLLANRMACFIVLVDAAGGRKANV